VVRQIRNTFHGHSKVSEEALQLSSLDRSLIAGVSAFQGMAPTDFDCIIGQARSLRIAKDQPVFEQEQEAHSFFLLLDGHARVIKT
jgi:hypothetical protein